MSLAGPGSGPQGWKQELPDQAWLLLQLPGGPPVAVWQLHQHPIGIVGHSVQYLRRNVIIFKPGP